MTATVLGIRATVENFKHTSSAMQSVSVGRQIVNKIITNKGENLSCDECKERKAPGNIRSIAEEYNVY